MTGEESLLAARPQLMRALNEQVLLREIRRAGPLSRADLGRLSGLSKPTVALALANLEADGLVRVAGRRTGLPGPAALLYEVRPEAGYVLGLDVGREYLRGALADLAGGVRARADRRAGVAGGPGRVAALVGLADRLLGDQGLGRDAVAQTVVGSPGVFDPERGAFRMARSLPGWERPDVVAGLLDAFGPGTMLENDVDLAALAERAHGHGRGVDSFAFVSIGTGVGMGLVIGGRLHRGWHGAAGEVAWLPLTGGHGLDQADARRRGSLEAAASAAAVVRAARRAGMRGPVSARRVFAAAADGDRTAARVVREEALVVARAVAAVVAVVDPELVVLGGGIGQAPGFAEAVAGELPTLLPVVPSVRVSALGAGAVVDGCLAAGIERAWERIAETSTGTSGLARGALGALP